MTFRSGHATLGGTLFLPDTPERHAAVALFHGSGPQPRDTLMGHWFAEQGVAALAYDKRGVNESTGDFGAMAFMDLVDDGLAAIALLKARADINAHQIGVWGLSQGGWLGPLAASRSKDVAFVIAVSGPGVSPGEQMVFYYGNQLRAQGFSAEEIEEASTLRRQLWRFFSTGDGYDRAKAALEQARSKRWFVSFNEQNGGLFSGSPATAILNDPTVRNRLWFRLEVNYDPTVALRALSVPALFVFGEHDELVPVQTSVAIIRETLTRAGHRGFTIAVFPGADHGITVPTSAGSREFAPGYLDTTRDWLRKTLAAQ